jgi:hypothetical protein
LLRLKELKQESILVVLVAALGGVELERHISASQIFLRKKSGRYYQLVLVPSTMGPFVVVFPTFV